MWENCRRRHDCTVTWRFGMTWRFCMSGCMEADFIFKHAKKGYSTWLASFRPPMVYHTAQFDMTGSEGATFCSPFARKE